MLKTEAAMLLAGITPSEEEQASAPTNLHVITGEISQASEDGLTYVNIDGLMFSESDDQDIEIDTVGGLEEGDIATIILAGENGRGMTPLAIGAPGSVDRIRVDSMKVHDLEADQLTATVGYIEDLTADNITAQNISATTGYIGTLETNNVTAQNVTAAAGYIGTLAAGNVTAANIVADHATVGNLDANYAKVDAANITSATVKSAWIDALLVQSGLLAHEGTIFTLDAIQVNAASINAGTIDVDRLLVTGQDGEKYLIHVDSGTGTPTYQKLDGGVIEDLTITADKIVAGAITAEKITTENIVGTGGWINLRSGTFAYVNSLTGEGIAWDGANLTISGTVTIGSGSMTLAEVAEQASQALETARDGAVLTLTSTNGQLFKNGSESTILQVAIFPNGGDRCDTISQVRAHFGASAYIEWKWMHESSGEWGTLLSTDSHLSRDGMWLTVTPEDVATKTTFSASLVVP